MINDMITSAALPMTEVDIVDEPITDADWATMSDAERAFIQAGIDAIDRGEIITQQDMERHFDSLLADIAKR